MEGVTSTCIVQTSVIFHYTAEINGLRRWIWQYRARLHKGWTAPPETCARTGYWIYAWENLPFSTIFGAYLMPQLPILGSKGVSYTKTFVGTWRSTHAIFHLVMKPLVLVKNNPKRLYGWDKLPFSDIFGPVWGLFNASVTHIVLKRCFHIPKNLSSGKKNISFGQKVENINMKLVLKSADRYNSKSNKLSN